MKKKKLVARKRPKFTYYLILGAVCAGVGIIGFFYVNSLVPVNSDHFVFGVPENHFIKIVTASDGSPQFAVQNTKGGKVVPGAGNRPPQILLAKGALVSIHLINEEKNTPEKKSQHTFNIDEFNVHSKTLGYFDTETITFIADKSGSFEYYDSIVPDMKGTIRVQ